MRDLVWKYKEKEVSRVKINEIENALGVKFPEDYIACAMINHGASSELDKVKTSKSERVFGALLIYDKKHPEDILATYKMIKARLIEGLFPFGLDGAGNFFCFDYRKDKENPSIVFWKHELAVIETDYSPEDLKLFDLKQVQEKAIEYVADSFTEFLDKLY